MGKGCLRARASAAARPVRLLGHADRQREVPHRRSDRRDRHAPRRSELELVGSALHVLDSADAADSHRRRSRGDRPQLSDRARRRAPTRSWRSRRWPTKRAASVTPIAAGCSEEIARGRKEFAANWADQWTLGSVPAAARTHPERAAQAPRPRTRSSSPTSAGTRTASASSSRSTCPARSSRRAVWRRWGSARRRRSASRWRSRSAHAIALVGDGGFSANPSVIATAMEADLPVIWVVMDNSAFGTIAGLEEMHYGTTFGCMFECDGKPYHIDYAAMARSFGADGYMVDGGRSTAARRCEAALASGRPIADPGADGERADADTGALGHQRHLSTW